SAGETSPTSFSMSAGTYPRAEPNVRLRLCVKRYLMIELVVLLIVFPPKQQVPKLDEFVAPNVNNHAADKSTNQKRCEAHEILLD
ncbi:hypothetical protein ABK046_47565, partial [Streptomyces caeruleatus]